MEIFEDMTRFGCERNVITYSSLISACEKASLTPALIPPRPVLKDPEALLLS